MEMKVMFFVSSLKYGGAQKTTVILANLFSEKGIETDLVVLNTEENNGSLLSQVSKKVNIINLNQSKVVCSIPNLIKILKTNHYTHIFSSLSNPNIACFIAKMISNSKAKLIFRECGNPSTLLELESGFFIKKLLKILVPVIYKKAYKVICVSEGTKEDFISYFKYENKNVCCVYDPVIDGEYQQQCAEEVQHNFFDGNTKVILGIGRLVEAKNFELLIRAFAKLYETNKELRLIILGDGFLRKRLEDLVSDLELSQVVSMPGFVENPLAYFKHSYLFAFSSKSEGLGGALVQALYSGVKVLSTDCKSGPSEILDNSKYGILVTSENVDAMVDGFRKVLSGGYVTFNEKAFNQHCSQFTSEYVFNKYIELSK